MSLPRSPTPFLRLQFSASTNNVPHRCPENMLCSFGRNETWSFLFLPIYSLEHLAYSSKTHSVNVSDYPNTASQVAAVVKNPPANAEDRRDLGLIPKQWRSFGGGHGNLLQYSCLENATDRRAWKAAVHGGSQRVRHDWVTKTQTHNPNTKTDLHSSSLFQACTFICLKDWSIWKVQQKS